MSKFIKKVRKFFWVEPSQAKNIEMEARKRKVSESALMREIISSWFQYKKW